MEERKPQYVRGGTAHQLAVQISDHLTPQTRCTHPMNHLFAGAVKTNYVGGPPRGLEQSEHTPSGLMFLVSFLQTRLRYREHNSPAVWVTIPAIPARPYATCMNPRQSVITMKRSIQLCTPSLVQPQLPRGGRRESSVKSTMIRMSQSLKLV